LRGELQDSADDLRPRVIPGVRWKPAKFAGRSCRRILLIRGCEALITLKVQVEREDDGRWLAEVVELPGVLAYGDTQEGAVAKVQALALRVIAERLEHGEAGPELLSISFNAA
jgi:predicted RNase H-like HicB family nuclease